MAKKQTTHTQGGASRTAKTRDTLTPRQARFVAEYLIDLNATQAAIRAGYSQRTANEQGCRLLAKSNVGEAVAKGAARTLRKLEVTQERVLREVAALAFLSVKELVDADDKLLPIGQWSPEAAAAVSSVEVAKRNLTAGDGVQEDVVKIRLWDKTSSLRDLMKHLGLLVEQVDVRVDVEVAKGLQRGREFNRLVEARDEDVVVDVKQPETPESSE